MNTADGDGSFTDAGETIGGSFNMVNEVTQQTVDSVNLPFTYDAGGQLEEKQTNSSGGKFIYRHDVWIQNHAIKSPPLFLLSVSQCLCGLLTFR